jgi:hypothetical protein
MMTTAMLPTKGDVGSSFYKRSFWEGGTKDEMRLSKEALFHGSCGNLGTHGLLTPLTSASFEIRISSFVPPSPIVVWEA